MVISLTWSFCFVFFVVALVCVVVFERREFVRCFDLDPLSCTLASLMVFMVIILSGWNAVLPMVEAERQFATDFGISSARSLSGGEIALLQTTVDARLRRSARSYMEAWEASNWAWADVSNAPPTTQVALMDLAQQREEHADQLRGMFAMRSRSARRYGFCSDVEPSAYVSYTEVSRSNF